MQENVISVSKLCGYIKSIFESEELLHNISVYGEISGISVVRGNAYFDLKDENAVLPCVYFGMVEDLHNGDKIIAVGTPGYYVKGGKLNFNVIKTKPYGLGELYQKFLELKNKLEKEGLFDNARKKPIPSIIKRIGVISSETGAVIQDIINIVTRRDDSVDIVLYPSSVQGISAEAEIISGIKFFENYNVDVIVVARGGGSFEDLNVFNSEMLARVVADCKKPIISAVGHETDYTIIDFVSDLRAPTPSAAAELLTQIKRDKKTRIKTAFEYLSSLMMYNLETLYEKTNSYKTEMNEIIKEKIREKEYQFALNEKILEKHNLNSILEKGFAYLQVDNKDVDIKKLKIGQDLKIYTKQGQIISSVKDIKIKE